MASYSPVVSILAVAVHGPAAVAAVHTLVVASTLLSLAWRTSPSPSFVPGFILCPGLYHWVGICVVIPCTLPVVVGLISWHSWDVACLCVGAAISIMVHAVATIETIQKVHVILTPIGESVPCAPASCFCSLVRLLCLLLVHIGRLAKFCRWRCRRPLFRSFAFFVGVGLLLDW